jgi:hypothetical protein
MDIAKRRHKGVTLVILGLLAGATTANAAQITWSTPSLISGPSDVSTQGTVAYAYSLGNTVVPQVNGVFFIPAVSNAGSPNYDYTDSNVLLHNYIQYTGFGVPPTVTDPQYSALLESAGYAPNAGNAMVFTLNVTQGQTYLVQMWANDGRQGDHVGSTETLADSSGGAPVTLTINEAYAGGGFGGMFVNGTFTADASTEVVTINGLVDEQQINAFQLRNITPTPEPASALALGIGAIGLLARRRTA